MILHHIFFTIKHVSENVTSYDKLMGLLTDPFLHDDHNPRWES